MVQISTVFSAAFAALAPLAAADICHSGQEWCGYHLLEIGDYELRILAALAVYGLPTTDEWKLDSLYSCTSAAGDIAFWTYCGGIDMCYVDNVFGDGCPS